VAKVLTYLHRGAGSETNRALRHISLPQWSIMGKEKMERGVTFVERIEGILTELSTQTYHCITTLI